MVTYSDGKNVPALAHTLSEFINMQSSDELTYRNFSILEKSHNLEILDHNILNDYLPEIQPYLLDITFDFEEARRYKYSPDLLAYDIYGSTQLDFVVMFFNGVIDPKEFDFDTVKLLYRSQLKALLDEIYKSELDYLKVTRSDNQLRMI
jgi:hypothetical protein